MSQQQRDSEAWRGLAGGSNEEAARRRPIQVVIQRIAEQVSDISAQYDDMLSEISSFHEQVERYEERTGATTAAAIALHVTYRPKSRSWARGRQCMSDHELSVTVNPAPELGADGSSS